MNRKNPGIHIITRPPGVGKTSISRRVANRPESSALVGGDSIYQMVVGGYISPGKDDGVFLELFWDNVVDNTNNFISRNISVVLE